MLKRNISFLIFAVFTFACKSETISGVSTVSVVKVTCPASRNTGAERAHILSLLKQEDFGAPLTPRKDYDLQAELSKYLSCLTCQYSTDPIQMRMMMTASRKDDIFIWILRPDGTFVVSKGPDDQMTHGVIASLNVESPELTQAPMGSALVGGEGWFDPSTQTLFINNKSGHYRPEYARLNNPSMQRIIKDIGSLDFLEINFVDATKPR